MIRALEIGIDDRFPVGTVKSVLAGTAAGSGGLEASGKRQRDIDAQGLLGHGNFRGIGQVFNHDAFELGEIIGPASIFRMILIEAPEGGHQLSGTGVVGGQYFGNGANKTTRHRYDGAVAALVRIQGGAEGDVRRL